MRGFALAITLLLAILVIAGSSGTFVEFGGDRGMRMEVVPHGNEYVGVFCENGYSAVVTVPVGSEVNFSALVLRNSLPGNRAITVWLYPDHSGLAGNLEVSVETEDGVPVTLGPGGEYTFSGWVRGDVPGEYLIPVEVRAEWDDGDATLNPCPIRVIVTGGPGIEKVLLHGNATGIPPWSYQEWVFQIRVYNPTGEDIGITVTDTVPAGLLVSETSASSGTYRFWRHRRRGRTSIEWNVTVPAFGSEHMNVTVFTGRCCCVPFTSPGEHTLNEGALIVEYGLRSNPIVVSVSPCHSSRCGKDREEGGWQR
ncbi:hypothetical protein [Thermococcus sp.]|uniref:hypothetical protein n=1 Tax=Thermococcus sp. TaxID=35749 RepID=UPI00262EA232|nr:hypothetical protein [Thermococcus sp.]